MNKIIIKIIGKADKNQLKRNILSLIKFPNLIIETSNSLDILNNEPSLRKISVLIITNEIINENRNQIIPLLKTISQNVSKLQIILMVDKLNVRIAVKALKVGAYQYIKQPVSNEELKLLIETAIDQIPQIIDQKLLAEEEKQRFGEILGSSPPMQQVYDQILQAAKTDIPIVILGETGTGKDLVAYTIHKASNRSESPYLPVNLGALPSELVASELFGHEKGAFTGALKQHKGVFEQGSKGTVFLDEIDTMDEKVQVSLLRLLEQKLFKRLGGTNSIRSYARLIAATNENLDSLVEAGIFRSDLFYRLDVFRISLPPLRERISDIPLLVDEMIVKYSKGYKKNIVSISKGCLDALMNFDWPGNVRELKNVIQRAVLVCNGKTLQVKHLPQRFLKVKQNTSLLSLPIGLTLEETEKMIIENALRNMKGNKSKAAKSLGISRRALYNKIEKHNI